MNDLHFKCIYTFGIKSWGWVAIQKNALLNSSLENKSKWFEWWKFTFKAGLSKEILLQCSVPEGDLHCQCILSIFLACMHQFFANILVFININTFLYFNNQFALFNVGHLSLILIRLVKCCFFRYVVAAYVFSSNETIVEF